MRLRATLAALFALHAPGAGAFDRAQAPHYSSPDLYRPNVDDIVLNGIARGASPTLGQMFAGSAVPVEAYMRAGDSLANVAPAVARAVAAGHKILRLPANSTYIPPNNTTPADVTLVGDPNRTSVVSVANRATDLLAIGARSSLRDIGIISSFCDQKTQPNNTQKICSVGQVDNVSDTTFAAQNWVGTRLFVNSGPNYTGPSGVVSHDLPSIQLIANGAGTDAIYAASNADKASAARLVTSAAGAVGAQIFNGLGCPTCSGTNGIRINEFGDGANNQKSLAFSRIGDATSIYADDYSSKDASHQRPWMQFAMSKQAGGNVIDLYQSGIGFAGNFMHINAAGGGAGWTGNYVAFDRGGSRVFRVDANGSVETLGRVTTSGLAVTGEVGFNGVAPVGKCSLPAALPTDGSATAAALAAAFNATRSCLIKIGLAQ